MAGGYQMDIGRIANDIAQVWGFPDFAAVPDFGKERIRIDINKAIQEMQDCGEDFYGRETLQISLLAGTSLYILPAEVQTVLEPVTLLSGKRLTKLTSRGQVLNYGSIFLSRADNTVPNGIPQSYFVEAVRVVDADDNVRTILQLLPAPAPPTNGTDKVVVPVIKEADLFSNNQLTVGTASLPIPHKYIESIFLPLARYNATTCFLFYKRESMSKYEADYERALQLLGKADPRQRPKPVDSSADGLEIRRQAPTPQGGQQQ